jgi:hypothetical protein
MSEVSKVKGSLKRMPLFLKRLTVKEFEDLQRQTMKGNAPYDWIWQGYTPQAGGGGVPAFVFIYVAKEPEKDELPDIDTLTLAARMNNKGEW